MRYVGNYGADIRQVTCLHVGRNAAALTLLTFVLTACASANSGSKTPTSSVARTASTSRLAVCQVPSGGNQTANWVSYVNPAFGYCLRHPPGWYRPISSDDQPNFSSEDVGTPLALSSSGIWFYVLVTSASPSDCPRTNTRDFTDGTASGARYLVSPTGTTIDGAAGVRFDGPNLVVVNVWRGRCYDFFCIIGVPEANRRLMDLILDSFRFGT